MFSRSDGPTRLRADLVRALSLSLAEIKLRSEVGVRRGRCAIAGVWNDRKGAVIVLVQYLDPSEVVRFAFSDPIDSESALEQAVDLALDFAESMGFMMDGPRFVDLPEAEREQRLARWDALRKPPPSAAAPGGGPGATPLAQPSAEEPSTPEPGRAVLGRIGLVQRFETAPAPPGSDARLRWFF